MIMLMLMRVVPLLANWHRASPPPPHTPFPSSIRHRTSANGKRRAQQTPSSAPPPPTGIQSLCSVCTPRRHHAKGQTGGRDKTSSAALHSSGSVGHPIAVVRWLPGLIAYGGERYGNSAGGWEYWRRCLRWTHTRWFGLTRHFGTNIRFMMT